MIPVHVDVVKDHTDLVGFHGIAEDGRALRSVLLALLGALGGKDFQEKVEILDLGRASIMAVLLCKRGCNFVTSEI